MPSRINEPAFAKDLTLEIKQQTRALARLVRGVMLAALCAVLPAWSAGDVVRFVNASRLPLRAAPGAEASVVTHVVTNQPLRLQATRGDWCEVMDNDGAKGFCLSKYLAESPLSLATIEDTLARAKLTPRERLDWLSRAFWVAPSLARWVEVGSAMDKVLLSAETREKEVSQGKPLRFKVPEFEAMKRRLEQGLVSANDRAGQKTVMGDTKEFEAAQRRAALPEIKPSLFSRGEVFVLSGTPFNIENNTTGAQFVDSLSAIQGVPFRVRVERPAYYQDGNADQVVAAWDVGEITAKFDQPLRLRGITRRGRPTALDIRSVGMSFNLGGCYGTLLKIDSKAVSGMPPWQDTLLAWVGKPATDKAKVKTRRLKGKGQYDALEIDDIDVDGDGIADFSVWNGRYEPQVSAEGYWQAIYVNVGGQWQLLSFEQDADCT